MKKMEITAHAQKRMQQRGMKTADVELIVNFGTRVPDGYLLRRKDVTEAVSDMKKFMTRLQRLEGRVVITSDGTVVTAYPTGRAKQKRLLSRAY